MSASSASRITASAPMSWLVPVCRFAACTFAACTFAAGAFAAGAAQASAWRIDDNLLAHRLLLDGRAAEAAEIFTDPAWKGIALYRSEQWWRAAEAFVRADDPVSAYNLGNCYVQLGYYALALDAYQRALAGDPDLGDASHNAELMRQLLADERDGARRDGRQDRKEAIDRLERNAEEQQPAGASDTDEDDATRSPDQAPPGSKAKAGAGEEPTSTEAAGDRAPGKGEGRSHPEAGRRDEASGTALGGQVGPPEENRMSGGASESDVSGAANEASAGLRARRESEQADEQWLNRIQHDPVRYLEKRIRLEMRRRVAAGQSAPAGGDGW